MAPTPKYNGLGSTRGPSHGLSHGPSHGPSHAPDFTNSLAAPEASSTSIQRSPRLSTSIPGASLDINRVSFSQRGSLLYPLYKRNGVIMTDRDSGFAIDDHLEKVQPGRSFPLVTPLSKGAQSDSPLPSPRLEPEPEPEPEPESTPESTPTPAQPQHHHGVRGASEDNDDDLANVDADSQRPPSIRLISVEAEKESQKVRSLYESAEGLNWEDGEGRASVVDERPVSPEEVPSNGDENDAYGFLKHFQIGLACIHTDGYMSCSQNVAQHGPPTQRPATTASPPVNFSRKPLVLAGGIEDWEGVNGEDVDRYGFITPPRPASRPATSSGAKSVHFSSRKKRNVLVRKDVSSRSLTVRSGPTKKQSALSLHSHTSELSTASHRSARSVVRQAANLLPHNKDRRLVDEAGNALATHPGLNDISEDELAEKLANELKFKEVERSEKWRRMANVVKPGADGQGMIFEFDMKHPKLISRTWKGIPDCWRSAAWYSFLTATAKASNGPFITDEELKADYRRLVEEPSLDDPQIDMDVPRTVNQHIMFRRRYRGGQRLLFRALHALSLYFPETGYVQGMAPLAATLLSYYEEEACFVMLVRLWKYRGLNQMYGTRDSELGELMNILADFEKHWLGDREVAKQLVSYTVPIPSSHLLETYTA